MINTAIPHRSTVNLLINKPSNELRFLANRLLAMMSASDLAALMPHMSQVNFKKRDVVQHEQSPVDRLYFLTTGAASVMMRAQLRLVQVQMIGPEGMIGFEAVMGDTVCDAETVMISDATGWEVSAKDFRGVLKVSNALRRLMARYAHYSRMQLGFYSGLRAGSRIGERIATLLLMISDRLGDRTFSLTHEGIATLLGVRRPGVTTALHELEGEHLIRSHRSSITIRDRGKLEATSMGAYGVCEAAYERIMMRQ